MSRRANPTYRYLNSLVTSTNGRRLVNLGVFPNVKEATESFGAHRAAMRWQEEFPPACGDIRVVCVGDGNSPRTAATFAVNSRWQCHSVDPRLKLRPDLDVPRLHQHATRIEEVSFTAERVIVVAVHAHVPMATALTSIDADEVLAISMPCCFGDDMGDPDESYEDLSVLSPQRRISVWRVR